MILNTSYIEIEELLVKKTKVTLECNLMVEGKNYSEAIPTNVILSLEEFIDTLNYINDSISNQILDKISLSRSKLNDTESYKIKINQFTKNWKVKVNMSLKPITLNDGFVIFYEFRKLN
ncbi:MAG: hypothetical protein KF732_04970 [Flavobacteriales bacterium]|nr:hypothetical protein [Flavobacteriales bacterium]MBX2959290.1 hypothetical protein [Flavobacteriales bacterium]